MSEQRECPACAMSSDSSEDVCPFCGYEFPVTPASVKWVAWLMALLLIWPVIELLKWLL